MFNFVKSVTAISLACGLAFTANAEENSEIVINSQGYRTVLVAYGDLDLTSPAGQDTLTHRVKAAVRKVCGGTNARPTLDEVRAYRDCSSQASKNALASLDSQTRARVAMAF